jgi:hypothetical protein
MNRLSRKENSQNMGIYRHGNTLLFSEPAMETLLRTMDGSDPEASRRIERFGKEFIVATFGLGGSVDGDKSFSC